MADHPPKRGVAYTFDFPVFDSAGNFVTGAAFGTIQVSGDGGTAATAANTPVEIATSTGFYRLTLTASEMTVDRVAVKIPVTSRPGVFVRIETVTRQLLDLGTKAKTDLIPGTIDGKTFEELVTLIAAVLLGKASGLATTTAVYRAVDDSKARVTGTVDSDGNRSAVVLDAS